MIKSEALEPSWAAGAPAYYASSAVPPSSTRGLEASLQHKSITFIFVAVVIIGLSIFILTYCVAYIIWSIILRHGERNHGAPDGNRNSNAVLLQASLVSRLPIVQYGSTEESKGRHEVQNVILSAKECAVCLSEFEAGEEMKVLPVCGHCFHKACIDTWLFSHTTCPICRLSLLKAGLGNSR